MSTKSDTCTYENVLSVFPNVDKSFVGELYQNSQSFDYIFVHLLGMNGEYPKKLMKKPKASLPPSSFDFSLSSYSPPSSYSSSSSSSSPPPLKQTINFKAVKENVPKAAQIVISKLLVNEFPFISVNFIILKLKEHNYHLFPTFKYFFIRYQKLELNAHPDDDDDVYDIKGNELLKHLVPFANTKRTCVKREEKAAFRAFPSLNDEISFVNWKKRKYFGKFKVIRALNNERSRMIDFRKSMLVERDTYTSSSVSALTLGGSSLSNSFQSISNTNDNLFLYECACCSQSYLVTEMLVCRKQQKPHQVCRYCLKTQLKTNISQSKGNIACMIDTACTAGYTASAIESVLNPRLNARFHEICVMTDLRTLNNPNVYCCPFCYYAVESDEKLLQLECKNTECGVVSCMVCKKAVSTHGGEECPSLVQKRETENLQSNFAAYVAEEIDKICIRTCPKCRSPIVKGKGCNQIHCTSCDFNFCYLCRKACEEQDNPSDHYSKSSKCKQYFSEAEEASYEQNLRTKTIEKAKKEWYTKHPNARHIKLMLPS